MKEIMLFKPSATLRQCLHQVSKRNLSTKQQEIRRKAMIDRFIRVDHAGEFGADRIYAGQLAILGPKGVGPLPFIPTTGKKVPAEETGALIQHMWDQEKEHLGMELII